VHKSTLTPFFLAVEKLDFTRDAAPDFTLATAITYRLNRL